MNTRVDALRHAAPLALLEHIVRGPHERLPVQVMTLEGLLRGPRAPEDAALCGQLDRLIGELWRALEPYLLTEERALFPLIQSVLAMRAAGRSDVPSAEQLASGPLKAVTQAHVRLSEGLCALSELLSLWPKERSALEPVRAELASFCAELRDYLRVESDLLLPALSRG